VDSCDVTSGRELKASATVTCGRGFPDVHLGCDEVVRFVSWDRLHSVTGTVSWPSLGCLFSTVDQSLVARVQVASIRKLIERLFVFHRIQCKYVSIQNSWAAMQPYTSASISLSMRHRAQFGPFLQQSLKFA
jgi:hypothetical protein